MNRWRRSVLATAIGLAFSAGAMAKEKCEGFSGDTKNNCMSDAKLRFGK